MSKRRKPSAQLSLAFHAVADSWKGVPWEAHRPVNGREIYEYEAEPVTPQVLQEANRQALLRALEELKETWRQEEAAQKAQKAQMRASNAPQH